MLCFIYIFNEFLKDLLRSTELVAQVVVLLSTKIMGSEGFLLYLGKIAVAEVGHNINFDHFTVSATIILVLS